MKKIFLLFSLIVITSTSAFAFDFDFILKDTKNNTKTCRAYDEGYVCENEKPVYISYLFENPGLKESKNFKSIFIPESLTKDVYAGIGKYKKCNKLKNGYYCKDEELPVVYTPIIKKKGVIIKSEDGTEKICKIEKDGSYTCGNEEQYFNPIIPFGTWKFYESDIDKKEGNVCTGYTNGYVCSDNKSYYIDNFRSYFDFAISYGEGYENFGKSKMPTIVLESEKDIWNRKSFDGRLITDKEHARKDFQGTPAEGILITDKENNQKVCRICDFNEYIQSGYACKGEPPVILKNRPKIALPKNTRNYYVQRTDILTGELTNLVCKRDDRYYYCPGETRKRVPPQTQAPKCTRTVEHVYINGKHINVSKEQCGDNIYIRY